MHDAELKVENSDKRFVVWMDGADSPETLTPEYFDAIQSSDAWFARKVDDAISPELLDRLDHSAASGTTRP
jgi:hypothetical protein